jgi:hypothetical protein
MGYGSALIHSGVPEWKTQYINYKKLKKILMKLRDESLASNSKLSEESDGKEEQYNHFERLSIANEPALHFSEESYEEYLGILLLNGDFSLPSARLFSDELARELFKVTTFFYSQNDLLTLQISAAQKILYSVDSNCPKSLKPRSDNLKFTLRELYHALRLLKSYHTQNYLAVAKIVKRYDQFMSIHSLPLVIEAMDSSKIYPCSHNVESLLKDVQDLFSHFTEPLVFGKTAVNSLKFSDIEPSHFSVFGSGVNLGILFGVVCSVIIAFILWFFNDPKAVIDRIFGDFEDVDQSRLDIATAIPLFRFFFMIFFNFFCWGMNVLVFEELKINAKFILHTNQKTFLKSSQLINISVVLTLILGLLFLIYSISVMFPEFDMFIGLKVYPAISLTILLFFTFFPFKYLLFESRKYFLRAVSNIIASPISEVTFEYSFIADQFTSSGIILLDFVYMMFFLFRKEDDEHFSTHSDFLIFCMFAACLPYWWRLAQCLKCARDLNHRLLNLLNALKYLFALLAVILNYANQFRADDSFWRYWLLFKVIAVIYGYIWDILVDWTSPKREKHELSNVNCFKLL